MGRVLWVIGVVRMSRSAVVGLAATAARTASVSQSHLRCHKDSGNNAKDLPKTHSDLSALWMMVVSARRLRLSSSVSVPSGKERK